MLISTSSQPLVVTGNNAMLLFSSNRVSYQYYKPISMICHENWRPWPSGTSHLRGELFPNAFGFSRSSCAFPLPVPVFPLVFFLRPGCAPVAGTGPWRLSSSPPSINRFADRSAYRTARAGIPFDRLVFDSARRTSVDSRPAILRGLPSSDRSESTKAPWFCGK